MFKKIKSIAEANPYGFTISLLDFSTPKRGYIVAMKQTQDHFGDQGLKKVLEIATQSTFLVGGWKEGDRFYYDCVMLVEDLETAIKLGKANEQIAIFDLTNGNEIRL